MKRDAAQTRWVLLGFLLLAPLVLRAPHRDVPGAAWLRSASAVLLRPSLGIAEVQARSGSGAERAPVPAEPARQQQRLREKLAHDVLDSQVAALFAAERPVRVPVLVEVLEARARRSGGRRTLLELQLPHDDELIEELAEAPVLIGESLVGFVQQEPSAAGNIVVRTLADRPVRGTRQRVVAEARSEADPGLPAIKLVVEGAGAEDPHPLQAFLTTPRHYDTWSRRPFPFCRAHRARLAGGASGPQGACSSARSRTGAIWTAVSC